ncbi:MAG: crossover junction endodeoxyribonuclease RuvC [Candidatus Eremiobacterota bacterium]
MEVILGVDPGTARTGYGVLAVENGRVTALDYGCLTTTPQDARAERLRLLFEAFNRVVEQHRPGRVVVEQLFFNRNVTTALAVGEARGVILLTAAQHGLEVCEYNPVQVKESLTGYGSASKDQVRQMVMLQLGLEKPPRPDDVSDALAIALCYLFRRDLEG